MNLKDKLISFFENNKGEYFSGEYIAEKFSVSRTAVWKAVKLLRAAGYNIDAAPNKGYCMSTKTDIVSAQGIKKYLKPVCDGLQLNVFSTVSSTNTLVREMAAKGAQNGYTAIANAQTDGRGRRGRNFFSPSDTGLYISLLLRPERYSSNQAVKLTTMAAVAVCEAIEEVSGKNAEIKWVNDIFVCDKKVCGILTEASFGIEDDFLEYAVLGIGINVYMPKNGFPDELQSIAGSVLNNPLNDGKNRLAAECLNRFMTLFNALPDEDYINRYRQKSLVVGKDIKILSADGQKNALALDIDNDCRLIVKHQDGRIETLSSGEISVKLS